MTISVLTIFPEMIRPVAQWGVFSRAVSKGIVEFRVIDIREHTTDKHRMTDDYPFGGGTGLVMKAGPILNALDALKENGEAVHTVLTSPSGKLFDNDKARALSEKHHLVFLCGRYKGVDERVMHEVDEELSIGDFILSGGELAAMVMIDAVSRFVPGVVGDMDSVSTDSFSRDMLDHPHYTRPRCIRGRAVPEVVLSGNHEKVELFRRKESIRKTVMNRPDLFLNAEVSEADKKAILELLQEGMEDA